MAEHLLHFGICSWEDITYVFNATGHLPAGLFARPLEQMTLAWEDIDNGYVLSKLSVNALIGLMAIDQAKTFKHSCSTDSSDVSLRDQ